MAVQLLMNFSVKNDQHFGHLLLHCLKAKPEAICQIDAATGKKETNASVISRSVRLAKGLRKLGMQPGDVLAISGKNHLDVHIPYYAAVFNGFPICGVDNSFKYDEVKALFKVILPKVAFCDKETYDIFQQVVLDLNLDTKVIKFGEGENSMTEFTDKYDDDAPLAEFKVAEIDVDKVYIWLPATSGSTGVVKVAAIKHTECISKFISYLQSLARITRMAPPTQRVNAFNVGPIYWLTGIFNAIGLPIMDQCKVQSSGPVDADHLLGVLKEYKPVSIMTSPSLLSSLLKKEDCDLSCLKIITVTGAKLRKELYEEGLSRLSKGSCILNMYGQTENIGPMMWSDPSGSQDAFRHPTEVYETKIVDPETGKEVTEPMGQGELWTRGPRFTEYYRNPEETKKAITEDGWYKTGDIFSKDDAGNFFFHDRLKTLIKYRNYHVVPAELEDLIRAHPGVREAIVTGIPHDDDSEHPVACVVRHSADSVTARDVIQLVADKLSDSKRLRGGVIFLDELPMTSTGKVALKKLKQIVLQSEREM